MGFSLSMYNIRVKNKDNYSLCGDNLNFLKCTTVFKIIAKCWAKSIKATIFSLKNNYSNIIEVPGHVKSTCIRYENLNS